jgi:hypothetical protein
LPRLSKSNGVNGARAVRWNFRFPDDVKEFWKKFQRVPARRRRTKRDEERYCLALYFLALATHRKLKYPIRIEEGESPDFIVTWHTGKKTGLEVTKATEPWVQRAMTNAEAEYQRRQVAAGGSGEEAQPVGIMLSQRGWVGDEAESEWLSFIRRAIERKLPKLPNFGSTARHDLLVYDDTPLPAVDRPRVLAALKDLLGSLKRDNPLLGRVSIIISLDVVFDSGRDFRVLPFVNWSEPQALPDFGERVEFAGEKAAITEIRKHLSEGRAIYSMDGRGRIVKRMPDGRRLEVEVKQNGEETIIGEIGSR